MSAGEVLDMFEYMNAFYLKRDLVTLWVRLSKSRFVAA